MMAIFITMILGTTASATSARCISGGYEKAKVVTHYMVPLLEEYDDYICQKLEGTCIYKKNGEEWLHNYGYEDQPLSQARCQNGYGNKRNCLHPCRVLAASMKHHRFGQIIFMKELVGKRCGNLKRDGFEMIHDGYVVVMDTGSPKHFNQTGRFDFFWGRCKDDRGGVCKEGAEEISQATTRADYCIVWDPKTPLKNRDAMEQFTRAIKAEAIQRGDLNAAAEFDLSHTFTSHPFRSASIREKAKDIASAIEHSHPDRFCHQ